MFKIECLRIFQDFGTFEKTTEFFSTRLLVIVESRAIAHLKAESETNSVEDTACSYLPSFRGETSLKIFQHFSEKRQS